MAAWLRAHVPESARHGAVRALLPLAGSLRGVRTDRPVVALTFDDGPDPASTPAVLDALATGRGTATFFVLAERAEAHPTIVARIRAEGHELGLHGLDHTRLTTLPAREVWRRLRAGRTRLRAVAGVDVALTRPPHGAQGVTTYAATRAAGLRPVVWSVDAGDWRDTSIEAVRDEVQELVGPGSIVVLHDTLVVSARDGPSPSYERVAMVRAVLGALEARGLTSVTVSALLRLGRPDRTLWFRS